MTEILLALLAALAPAVVFAIILIRKDKAHPEPSKWLWAAVGLGILAIPADLLLITLLVPYELPTDTVIGAVLSSFLDAAIPEESCKFLGLLLIAKTCKYFDEYYDGIVYAVCIGMGFAGLENITYIVGQEEWFITSITRALLSVPMHYVFAVIMGTFFALGWFDKRNRAGYMAAALLLPILVHGIYDSLCFVIPLETGVSATLLLLFLIGFVSIRKYTRRLANTLQALDSH